MNFSWLVQFIIFPVAIIVYYVINTKRYEKSYQLVKAIWYFYYAIATIYSYMGEESITSDILIGFTVALALFEGLPGFINLKIWMGKILFKKRN